MSEITAKVRNVFSFLSRILKRIWSEPRVQNSPYSWSSSFSTWVAMCTFLGLICSYFIDFWDPDNCFPVPSCLPFYLHSLCASHCVSKDLTDSATTHWVSLICLLWGETVGIPNKCRKGNSVASYVSLCLPWIFSTLSVPMQPAGTVTWYKFASQIQGHRFALQHCKKEQREYT